MLNAFKAPCPLCRHPFEPENDSDIVVAAQDDEDVDLEVEQILGHRYIKNKLWYYYHWVGKSP